MNGIKAFFTQEKINAFAVHLAASLAIFLTLLYINLTQWYPQPLFKTDGGWNVLRIIIFVDVVLGPLLTLIIYRKGKPHLKLDMGVIILCQLIALVAGGWITYSERPIYVALDEGQLNSVAASLYKEAEGSPRSLDEYGSKNTRIVAVKVPENFDTQSKIYLRGVKQSLPIHVFSEIFGKAALHDFRQPDGKFLDLNALRKNRPESASEIKAFRARYPDANENFIVTPFRSRYRYWAAVIDRESLQLVDVLDIRLTQENYFEQKGGKLIPRESKKKNNP